MKKEILLVPLISLCGGLAISILEGLLSVFLVDPLTGLGGAGIPFSTGASIFSILDITSGGLYVLQQAITGIFGYIIILVCGLLFCRRLSFRDCLISCSIVAAYRLLYRIFIEFLLKVFWDTFLWTGISTITGLLRVPLKIYSIAPVTSLLRVLSIQPSPAFSLLLSWGLGTLMPFLFLLFAKKDSTEKQETQP